MKSGRSFNRAVRVKEEPSDELPVETMDGAPTLETSQLLTFPRENSTRYELGRRDDELEVVFECEDVKPNVDLSVARNHSRNVKPNQTVNIVKRRIHAARDIDLYTCRACKRNFRHKCNLRTHVKTLHADTASYPCDLCDIEYTAKRYLERHVDAKHNGVQHRCRVCSKSFAYSANLKRHVRTLHEAGSAAHPCDACGKSFARKDHLANHVNETHRCLVHECHACGKEYTQKASLKAHIDSAHLGVVYPCDSCDNKIFKGKRDLRRHVKLAHGKVLQ